MASDNLAKLIFLSLLIYTTTLSYAQNSASKPKAIILPITKDPSTLQYLTQLKLGTPFAQKSLVLDLGGRHLWIDCESRYTSTTYKPAYCGSSSCSVAKAECVNLCGTPPRPGCNNNTCALLTQNTVWGTYSISEVALDTISLQSTDGSKPLSNVHVPNFIFACSDAMNLDKLAKGVDGMLGVSKWVIALPRQLSSSFGGSFARKLALCLPSTATANGVMFLGDSPYVFHPSYNPSKGIDVSSRLKYTKLYVNYEVTASPRVQGLPLPGYFVKVTSILVNRKAIPINSTLLDFHRTGFGGSKISTIQPYTVLESSIYKSLVKAFDKEISASNVSKVGPIAPFTDCYTRGHLGVSRVGLTVPDITLVFENKGVKWNIFGGNSMVEMSPDVVCLGFLDGGNGVETSIVIGGHQLQGNLVQFDISANKMGFTSTLLLDDVECSNFKF